MLVVKFIRGYKSYIVGDIAGFKDNEANFLCEKNYAENLGEVEDTKDEQPNVQPESKFNFGKEMPKLGELICAVCGKGYKTVKGLKKHLWQKHQIKKSCI